MVKFNIRKATKEDMVEVHKMIGELAHYENAPNEVEITPKILEQDGFDEGLFDVLLAEIETKVVGFALFYWSYSTWKGKALYLEDFIVKEAYRGQGIGKALFEAVIDTAKNNGAKRMDWQVLDWNEPAINFYKKYPVELDGEWLNGRLYEKDLKSL